MVSFVEVELEFTLKTAAELTGRPTSKIGHTHKVSHTIPTIAASTTVIILYVITSGKKSESE